MAQSSDSLKQILSLDANLWLSFDNWNGEVWNELFASIYFG